MAFSGLATNEINNASELQRSMARMAIGLAAKETPILSWLGDSPDPVTSIKHEFIEDQLLPRTIVASTAIGSATAATGFQVSPAGIGNALNVGQLIRNLGSTPEVMMVTSIPVGGNSVVVSRAFDGGAIGSLAPGGTLYVGGATGVEGADHSGADTRRPGVVRTNTVGLFRMELAQSNTLFAVSQYGNDAWSDRKAKAFTAALCNLENEVVYGVLNGSNSLASSSTPRTFQGIKAQLTAVNSTGITSGSFLANPHKYIGDVWEGMYGNGASPTETWGIIAGSTWYRGLSDLNDTKVYDSNESEEFKRVIRMYSGPFGRAELFLSRVLSGTELLIVPKDRLKVKNLVKRSFDIQEMAPSGDNMKALLTGEYTLELYHQQAMGRLSA